MVAALLCLALCEGSLRGGGRGRGFHPSARGYGRQGRNGNYVIFPAHHSKAHIWSGVGGHDAPASIPKFRSPRWLPDHDSTYTAMWVPNAPEEAQARSSSGHHTPHHRYGFGHPKAGSIINNNIHASHGGPAISINHVKPHVESKPHQFNHQPHRNFGRGHRENNRILRDEFPAKTVNQRPRRYRQTSSFFSRPQFQMTSYLSSLRNRFRF